MDILLIAASGFIMGFVGSIPPTGPVALMVIRRTFEHRPWHAFAAGVGGALAEVVYSGLAVFGVGLVLKQIEVAETAIRGFSTLVLLGVGFYFFVTPVSAEDVRQDHKTGESLGSSMGHLAQGFSVGIVNPTLILNWTVAVALFFSYFQIDTDLSGRILFVVGVGSGIITWTAVQVYLLRKFQEWSSVEMLGKIQRAVSVLVIGAALYLGYETVANL